MFEQAEATILDLVARVEILEGAPEVDLAAKVAALEAEVAELDARLDAISGAAADPTP